MITWWSKVALVVLAGVSAIPVAAQTEVQSEWRIEHEQGAMPFELMPRRYVDYPVAYAVWQLAGVAAGCEAALPAVAERASALGYWVLDAGGFAVGERQATWQRFVSIVSRQVGIPDTEACRAALREAEHVAVNAVAQMAPVGR